MRPSLLALAVLLAGAGACTLPGDAAWSGLHANGYAGGYFVNADATARDVQTNSSVPDLNFEGDLEVDENDETVTLVGVRAGIAPLEIAASQFSYDGRHDSLITGSSTFRGFTLTNEDLDSTTDLDVVVSRLTLGLDVLNTPAGRVGLLAGVDFLEFDRFVVTAQESDTTGSIQAGESVRILSNETAPVPIVGVRGDLQLPYGTRMGAGVTGMSVDVSDVDATFLDADLNLNWTPWKYVEVVVGYRYVSLDLEGEVDDVTLDVGLDFDGPYAGVSLYW